MSLLWFICEVLLGKAGLEPACWYIPKRVTYMVIRTMAWVADCWNRHQEGHRMGFAGARFSTWRNLGAWRSLNVYLMYWWYVWLMRKLELEFLPPGSQTSHKNQQQEEYSSTLESGNHGALPCLSCPKSWSELVGHSKRWKKWTKGIHTKSSPTMPRQKRRGEKHTTSSPLPVQTYKSRQ